MPFKIQRVPRALQNLLSLSGGQTPTELEDRVRGMLDILQLYGATQLQSGFANNAALAEGGTGVVLTLHPSSWTVLFGTHGTFVKTATMTAFRGSVSINRQTQFGYCLFQDELGPFGATETGSCQIGGMLPYPLVCPPGTTVSAAANIIGTDATANVSIFAEFGVMGF